MDLSRTRAKPLHRKSRFALLSLIFFIYIADLFMHLISLPDLPGSSCSQQTSP